MLHLLLHYDMQNFPFFGNSSSVIAHDAFAIYLCVKVLSFELCTIILFRIILFHFAINL